MASVTLEHVSKQFGDVTAVGDLSLEIRDGEILVLIGPSGCGKTTVLRLVAGLETPDTGTVAIDGRDMHGVAPGERNLAMVFEDYALYPHMAVGENLAFALRIRGTADEEIDRRVSSVAASMELEPLLERRPPGLATGEAQHVAVGRAVVRETPSLFLLDDALAHLDAQQRLEARAELGRLHLESGVTVVSVTHDQAEALAVGTRLAVMDAGLLRQIGTPRELYEHPADTFVADFIGSPPMNLMEMTVERHGDTWALRRAALDLPAPQGMARAGIGPMGPSVTVGIRPGDIRLTPPATTDEVGFRGRCELVEYLGSRLLVHIRVGECELLALDDPADDVRRGDLLDCSTSLDRVHLFDFRSGRAISAHPRAGAVGA